MKKVLTAIIAVCLLVALCSCSSIGKTLSEGSVTSDSTGSGSTDSSGNTTTVYPEEISLPITATMVVGDTLTLSVSYLPSETTVKNVTWESSDNSVATVNASSGLITALKSGSATIVATAESEEGAFYVSVSHFSVYYGSCRINT